MSAYRPGWRIRVFAPRSTDATEQTVLTPAAGAPHSDRFQYATCDRLRANMIANPQLDTTVNGWAAGGGSGSRDTGTPFPGGVASFKHTTTNASSSGPIVYGSGTTTRYVVAAGTSMAYSICLYATGAAIGKTMRLVPHYYLSGDTGGGVPDAAGTGPTVTLVAGWQRLTFVHVVPASMTRGLLACYTDVAEGVFDVWAAGAQVEVATAAGR